MDALHLMYARGEYIKPDLTVKRLTKLIYDIKHKMGFVYFGDVVKIQLGIGFEEIKILFPLKHFNGEIADYLNNISEIDRWSIMDNNVGIFFK